VQTIKRFAILYFNIGTMIKHEKLKRDPTIMAIIAGGVVGVFIGFLPLFGLLVSGAVAGYMAQKKSKLLSALIGIASGLLSVALFLLLLVAAPSLLSILSFILSFGQGGSGVFLLIYSFTAAPIGGLIGGWIAKRYLNRQVN
jgi:hypothetical protein